MATPKSKRRKKTTQPPDLTSKPAKVNLQPFQVRLEPGLIDRINRFATAEGISASAYARRILINQVPGG